ncbi:hypothetical protein [Cupriavidus necator]|uniref:hypothetical protein n=1 Tax=Cupriavidus necator TaxID=106590 RepID=UPI00339D714D
MTMRFGLDKHPILARTYAALVMGALPFLFPVLFVIAYAPDAMLRFIEDLSRNYRDAWRVFKGDYHRKKEQA